MGSGILHHLETYSGESIKVAGFEQANSLFYVPIILQAIGFALHSFQA